MLNEDFGKSLVVFIGWMLFRKKFPKTLLTPPMPALPRCAAGQAWDWDAPLLASDARNAAFAEQAELSRLHCELVQQADS
jgi:hypothetical protein